MPNDLERAFEHNGYYDINVCYSTVTSSEAMLGQMFIHEYIHQAGPVDHRGKAFELPQALQLSSAGNYHVFAREVVLNQTEEEMRRR